MKKSENELRILPKFFAVQIMTQTSCHGEQ